MLTSHRTPRPLRLAAVGVLVAVAALGLSACSSGSVKGHPTVTVTAGGHGSSAAPSTDASSSSGPPAKPVHVQINISDGAEVGVGMPLIATFKVKITSGVAMQQATKVTVNGSPVPAAWFFEYSDPASGHLMEAHLRTAHYWPAHARIHVDMPFQGLSAGKGLAFNNSLTSDFTTGPANIGVVDDASHTLTVTSDGKLWGRFPVSLGSLAAHTPTARGIKVIMEKGADICMSGTPPNAPPYHECHIKWTQRLTYGGEYLHAAPWNCIGPPGCTGPANNIGRADSSNGCTNLYPADAQRLYSFLRIGDVVQYPNANGKPMGLGDGYGDWNLSWSAWQTGGAVATH